MIIEMRTYKTKPGFRANFLEIFMPISAWAGIDFVRKILGPFLSPDDPDTLFFMRGFPEAASREPMKANFHEGELWKTELKDVLMPLLDKYDSVLVDNPDAWIRFD